MYVPLALAHELLGALVPDDAFARLTPTSLDRRIVRIAQEVLAAHPYDAALFPDFFDLTWGRSTAARRHVLSKVLGRDVVAARYGVPRDSHRICGGTRSVSPTCAEPTAPGSGDSFAPVRAWRCMLMSAPSSRDSCSLSSLSCGLLTCRSAQGGRPRARPTRPTRPDPVNERPPRAPSRQFHGMSWQLCRKSEHRVPTGAAVPYGHVAHG